MTVPPGINKDINPFFDCYNNNRSPAYNAGRVIIWFENREFDLQRGYIWAKRGFAQSGYINTKKTRILVSLFIANQIALYIIAYMATNNKNSNSYLNEILMTLEATGLLFDLAIGKVDRRMGFIAASLVERSTVIILTRCANFSLREKPAYLATCLTFA